VEEEENLEYASDGDEPEDEEEEAGEEQQAWPTVWPTLPPIIGNVRPRSESPQSERPSRRLRLEDTTLLQPPGGGLVAPNPALENTLNHSLSSQHTPSSFTWVHTTPSSIAAEHRDETEDPEVTDFWAPNPASENTLNHSLSWQHTPSCITSEHRDETEDPEVTDFWSRVNATAEANRIQTATQSPRLRALSDTLHSSPNRFRVASLSQEQYFEVVAWIARLENRPAQGIYRLWIEPSDDPVDVQPYVRPTTDTDYSVGMRSVRRGIYRDNGGLGTLSLMQVGQHLHVTGQWESFDMEPEFLQLFLLDGLGLDYGDESDEENATVPAELLATFDAERFVAAAAPEEILRHEQETIDESVPPTRMGDDMTHPNIARITGDFGPDSPVLPFMANVPVDQSPSQHRLVTLPAPVPAQPPQLPEPPSFDSSNNVEL
jgi:hypothetical protein